MSQNYFTGQITSNKPDKNTQETKQQTLNQQYNESIDKKLQNINLDSKQEINKQQNLQQQQKQDFVDVNEVIVQNQNQDQQKFIQSNPTLAAQQKKVGNDNYTSGNYTEALIHYRKCLQYTAEQSQSDKSFKSIICSNIGLTYMKMNQDQQAISYFKRSLQYNQKYTKARTNLGQCYQNTDKIQEALEGYKKVLQINPNDNYVKQKIIPLQIKVKDLQQKRKQQVMSGLKNIGNSILGYFGMSLDNFKLQKGQGGGYNIQFKQ